MDLLAYFRVLGRRWWMIAVCIVLGAGLGWATTVVSDSGSDARSSAKASRTYYKATHTFLLKGSDGNSNTFPSSFTNLDQMALLATTGPVPDAVAKKLGADNGPLLAEQVTTLTNGITGTLTVTAVDPDADRAAQLSDAFADELVTNLSAQDLALYQKTSTDAAARMNALQAKIDPLIARIAAVPPPSNADALKSQLNTLQNQYADASSTFDEVSAQDPPTSPLSTLQTARAVPISASEYATRLRQGQQGENNKQAGTPQQDTVATVEAPSGTSLDSTGARVALGAFLGLLLGIGLAVLLERLDRRIRTHADAEAAFGVPVLADVPDLSNRDQRNHVVISVAKPLSPGAEAYRTVRSSLLFQRALADTDSNGQHPPGTNGSGAPEQHDGEHREPLVILVTSAAPKDGKTTSSANLAAVFAEAGASVLLLNCDFRRPTVHQYFDVSDEPRRVHRTSIPGVKVVSNVTTETDPNPAKVIAMQRHLVSVARGKFDVVILDTAPLLSANDALEMASEADYVVLVARAGWSKVPATQRAMEMLERVEAPVVGAILVGLGEAENYYYAYSTRSGRAGKGRRHRSRSSSNGHGDRADATAPALSAEEVAGS